MEIVEYAEGLHLSCEPQCCDLWLFSTEVDAAGCEMLEHLLSADEKMRADGFRFEKDRRRFIAVRGALRRILASYSATPPERLEFQTGTYGKPSLLAPAMGIEFNVSHSGGYALIGVTSGIGCGVDLERGRANINETAIAERFFCAREVEWLSRTERGFLRLWALKEAIIKAVGHGLSIPLSDVDVTDIVESKTSSITLRTPLIEPQTLWLNELVLLPNFAAAVATLEEKCRIRRMPHLVFGTES